MKSKLSPAHEHPRVTAKRAEIVAAEARLQQAIRREKAARARLRERLPVVQSGDLKEGEILWSWSAHKHFDELGFDPAKTILFRDPGLRKLANGSVGDWLHINSVSLIGPNRHFDASDARFHPDNLIWGSREAIRKFQLGRVV
jgi:hypothetical protein